ncbi:MAG: tetratricopeptide repeat protein [Parvularculaceae bacterium]
MGAALSLVAPAHADHDDPSLDGLFDDLKRAEAADAPAIAARIDAIWADAPSDTVNVLYERAEASFEAGDADLARIVVDHALALGPGFAQGYALRAAIRLRIEDVSGAVEDLERAIDIEPRHYPARIVLGEILADGGEPEAAFDMLQEALLWNPHAERARDAARRIRRELDGQEI